MGCDFFWMGAVENIKLQQKVISFIKPCYEDALIINPLPESSYNTLITKDWQDEKIEALYPFNFFGLAPYYTSEWNGLSDMVTREQFVFDRSDGGRLITLEEIPSALAGFKKQDAKKDYEVKISHSPKTRCLNDGAFFIAMRLNVLKLRYIPELVMADDYNNCSTIENNINKLNLRIKMSNEELSYIDCIKLYCSSLPD